MRKSNEELWQLCQKGHSAFPSLGLTLDLNRMNFGKDFFETMAPHLKRGFAAAIAEVEKDAIASHDESRPSETSTVGLLHVALQ